MKFIKQIERFQKLDKLIKAECTGTQKELADKLGISRSNLYRLIDSLKDYGAEIKYCRKPQRFCYKNPFNIEKLGSLNNFSPTKMEKIKGGYSKKTFPSFIMRRNTYICTPYFAQNKDIAL
jgi:DNA-binding XRE family transcriptional regulator